MRKTDWISLFVLAALWGGSFLFIRVGVAVLGPFVLVASRVLLAGALLLAYGFFMRHSFKFSHKYKDFLILGLLNCALPFCLIGFAELHLTASLGAILNATIPLFTALLAAIFLGEKLTPLKIAALWLGLLGVAIVAGWSPLTLDWTLVLAVSASLTASFFYGCGSIFARLKFREVPALTLATGQQLAAGLLLTPLAATALPNRLPDWDIIGAVLFLAIGSTAIAYILYFNLMKQLGPTRSSLVTFLVPVFGIIWGALFLAEAVSWGTIIGFGVILASLVLLLANPRARK